MPRRRMIDPEIWRNEKVGNLSDAARLLFIGIFSQADDDGRLRASPRFLAANIFPYDKDKTESEVRKYRDECARAGLIRVYTNGKNDYLDIPGWQEHQHIRRDRYIASDLPPFEEGQEVVSTDSQPDDNQVTTTEQPNDSRQTTDGWPSIGEGRGGEYSNTGDLKISSGVSDGHKTPTELLTKVKSSKQPHVDLYWLMKEKFPDADWGKQSNDIGYIGKILKDEYAVDVFLQAVFYTEAEMLQKGWTRINGNPISYVRQNIFRTRRPSWRGEATHEPEDFKGEW